MGFWIPQDHYFRYRLETSADGLSLEILASADLDCDGEWSSYRRFVQGRPWTDGACDIVYFEPIESVNPHE
jgi:hypothetical protein